MHFIQYFSSIINLVSFLLMIITFSIVIKNIELFNVRRGSCLHIYIGIFACCMHIYEWRIKHSIKLNVLYSQCGFVIICTILFAILTEIISVFYGHYYITENTAKVSGIRTLKVNRKAKSIQEDSDDIMFYIKNLNTQISKYKGIDLKNIKYKFEKL